MKKNLKTILIIIFAVIIILITILVYKGIIIYKENQEQSNYQGCVNLCSRDNSIRRSLGEAKPYTFNECQRDCYNNFIK